MQTYPPGTRIGQYEIASRPMMGGMGVVYFALDHGNDGRPVALKTFRPELLPDRAARDRFLREGTAWVELGSHPNIVRCYSVEYHDPIAFLVLELIAKEENMPDASLRSWLIPGHPLPLEQALLFALQIARGMQYATEKIPGFVHRDLKPENILVGADRIPNTSANRLRVTDFGLAKTLTDISTLPTLNEKELSPNQIQFTRGVGTPLYMAPEQWKGEPVGVFTDVYAFGCVLYEMLSGQHVIDGDTISALEVSHCQGKLRAIPADLPRHVEQIITKCLTLNPVERSVAWDAIIGELEQAFTAHSRRSAPKISNIDDLAKSERLRIAWSYNALGIAYMHIGNAEAAKRYFERTLAVGNEEGDAILKAAAKISLGNMYSQLGDSQRAIQEFEETLQLTREIGHQAGEILSLGGLGNAYLDLGNPQRALEYYQQQLNLARKIGDLTEEATALGRLGNTYSELGDTKRAIGHFEQSLEIYRNIGDRRGEGALSSNLGVAYKNSGNVERAIEYYERALRIAQEIGNRRGQGLVSGNLGSAYLIMGDARRAIGYHEQDLEISREIGDRRGEASALGNLGSAYMNLGDTQRASGYFEQALQIHRVTENLNGIATAYFNMALLNARQGDINRALSLAQEAAQAYTQIGHQENARDAEQLIALLQNSARPIQTNPVQAAFEAFQRAASTNDMQIAVKQYQFMKDKQFLQAIEEIISEQVPRSLKPAFEQRLAWLKQLAIK